MGQWLYPQPDSRLHQYIPSARKIEVLSVRVWTERSNPDKKGIQQVTWSRAKKNRVPRYERLHWQTAITGTRLSGKQKKILLVLVPILSEFLLPLVSGYFLELALSSAGHFAISLSKE